MHWLSEGCSWLAVNVILPFSWWLSLTTSTTLRKERYYSTWLVALKQPWAAAHVIKIGSTCVALPMIEEYMQSIGLLRVPLGLCAG